MRLLRYGAPGNEKPGILDSNGGIRDLSEIVTDIDGSIFRSEVMAHLKDVNINTLPHVDGNTRLGPCVNGSKNFVCIGLNYADHAAEANRPVPKEPIIFMKSVSAIAGADDDIEIPRGSTNTDWEVELGVVIGKRAKYIEAADWKDYVGGYCTVNDVSERTFQSKREGQWTKGKSHDTFGPIGPWLVTTDEVSDPQNLRLWCDVDGHRYQNGSTKTMIFDVAYLVTYLSQFMTLYPGDIIATGTPPGVGMGVKPQAVFLKPGQKVVMEVEGLGQQNHLMINSI